MTAAGTNVAAIHYHFGSKEVLVEAVVRSRLEAITTSRDALLARHPASDPVDARELGRAFIQPVLDVAEGGGRDWVRVIGHLLATNDPGLAPISLTFFDRNARFIGLMERLEPHPSARTIAFRLAQAMSLTLRVLGDVEHVQVLLAGTGAPWTSDEVAAQLLDVVTAVLAGPPAAPRA